MTFGAVIYECHVPPAMWVAPGPPHLKAFRQMEWGSAGEAVELTPRDTALSVAP
jgi:hypothetical protein